MLEFFAGYCPSNKTQLSKSKLESCTGLGGLVEEKFQSERTDVMTVMTSK